MHLDAIEHEDSIVFLHAVKEGPANQSYGLQVAALAGVPRPVIGLARQRLQERESEPAMDLLREAEPDELSPREALDLVYRLKGLLADNR